MSRGASQRKPPKTQSRRPRGKRPPPLSNAYLDVTRRPLHSLLFLLPMVLAYEIGMAMTYSGLPIGERRGLAAEQLLHWFFSLFGATGAYLPGAVLVAVLLGWHVASRHPWKVSLQPLLGMAGESVLLAIPLLLLHQWLPGLRATTAAAPGVISSATQDLLLSVGAGIYEELLFRLIAITLLILLFVKTLGMKEVAGVALAVVISSLLFGLHHYAPIGEAPWAVGTFAFRTAAGAYLAAVFVSRGFGLAVGCHVMYDVIAFLQSP